MLPRSGIRQSCHVFNSCRQPVKLNITASRQLSTTTTPSAKLASQAPNPRNAFISPKYRRIGGVGARANYSLWPWAKSSTPEFKDIHTPAGDKSTTTISDSIASFIPPPHDAAAASKSSNAAATPLPPSPAETSTLASAQTPATPSPVDITPQEIATPLFQQLPDTISTSNLTNMTEHVGFMKEMGLDYGWGPTSTIQYLLESIHVYTGTPWWGSVVITAAAVRLLLLYPFFRSTNEMAKMGAMKPVMDKLQEKYQLAAASGNALMTQQATTEMLQAKKIAGLKIYWMWAPMVIQGVLGYCSFKLLRAMANLPVPGLQDGGFLWLKDLTVSDPFFVLPLAMMALMHGLGRMGGESGSGQMTEIMKPVLLYVMPGIFGLVLAFMPAVLQVSFFTAATLGMAQGYIFRQPGFRKKMGLLPIIPPGTPMPNSKAAQRSASQASGAGGGGGGGGGVKPKLRVLTPQPMYKAPTVKGTVKAVEKDQLEKLGPIGAAWRDTKTSMDKIWEKANTLTEARKSKGMPGGKESKRDRRELETALSYEKRRKVEMERDGRGR